VGYEVAVSIIILYFFRPVIIIVVVKANFINTVCVFFVVQTEIIVSLDKKGLTKLWHEGPRHEVMLPWTVSTVGAGLMVIKSCNVRFAFSILILRFL
jgi:hypothetical protein